MGRFILECVLKIFFKKKFNYLIMYNEFKKIDKQIFNYSEENIRFIFENIFLCQ